MERSGEAEGAIIYDRSEEVEETIIDDHNGQAGQQAASTANWEREFADFGRFVSTELIVIAENNIWAARDLKMKVHKVMVDGYMEWMQQNVNVQPPIVSSQPDMLQAMSPETAQLCPFSAPLPQPITTVSSQSTSAIVASDSEQSDEDSEIEYYVYGEDGDIFDARIHRYMAVYLPENSSVASVRFHKKIAQTFGCYVDEDVRKLEANGVPVKRK